MKRYMAFCGSRIWSSTIDYRTIRIYEYDDIKDGIKTNSVGRSTLYTGETYYVLIDEDSSCMRLSCRMLLGRVNQIKKDISTSIPPRIDALNIELKQVNAKLNRLKNHVPEEFI